MEHLGCRWDVCYRRLLIAAVIHRWQEPVRVVVKVRRPRRVSAGSGRQSDGRGWESVETRRCCRKREVGTAAATTAIHAITMARAVVATCPLNGRVILTLRPFAQAASHDGHGVYVDSSGEYGGLQAEGERGGGGTEGEGRMCSVVGGIC